MIKARVEELTSHAAWKPGIPLLVIFIKVIKVIKVVKVIKVMEVPYW